MVVRSLSKVDIVLSSTSVLLMLPEKSNGRSRCKMVLPGDMDVDLEVTLIKPVAIENELRFAIREGGRTVVLVSN